jgi:hypothetical protein
MPRRSKPRHGCHRRKSTQRTQIDTSVDGFHGPPAASLRTTVAGIVRNRSEGEGDPPPSETRRLFSSQKSRSTTVVHAIGSAKVGEGTKLRHDFPFVPCEISPIEERITESAYKPLSNQSVTRICSSNHAGQPAMADAHKSLLTDSLRRDRGRPFPIIFQPERRSLCGHRGGYSKSSVPTQMPAHPAGCMGRTRRQF